MRQMHSTGFKALWLICFIAWIEAFQPEFGEPIVNITVSRGRDATFKCVVVHLGGYRVGWVKADTKAIQAIHDHVITHNPRVSVSHSDHSTWNLHIKAVIEEDQGQYMCQINTDPMKSQLGALEVVVPPDFVPEETSGDLMVPEGSSARASCRARGSPPPRVLWRREDGKDIVLREHAGTKSKVTTYQGEVLLLTKITRSEMGAYLCIASNGVPPSVSKRIMVSVHFHPVIQVPNQLVGAPLGTDVALECYVEASPKSINYWLRENNEMVISSSKYVVHNSAKSMFESKMTLTMRRLQPSDLGAYRCIAKNSLGEVEGNIRLYEIPGPTRKSLPNYDDNDENGYSENDAGPGNQFGSAEVDDDDDSGDDGDGSEVTPDSKGRNLPPPHPAQGKQATPRGKGASKSNLDNKIEANKCSKLPLYDEVFILIVLLVSWTRILT